MKIIEPNINFNWMTPDPLFHIERAARKCYKTEDKIQLMPSEKLIKHILNKKHFSVIEHACASYDIVCDRGVSHEAIRHRLFSVSQESTRYCNYSKDKFGNQISTIKPHFNSVESDDVWSNAVKVAEDAYLTLLKLGEKPDMSRSVLPTCLKTEYVLTGNFREWMHFFAVRTSNAAHPQMREIAFMILNDIRSRVSIIFEELLIEE